MCGRGGAGLTEPPPLLIWINVLGLFSKRGVIYTVCSGEGAWRGEVTGKESVGGLVSRVPFPASPLYLPRRTERRDEGHRTSSERERKIERWALLEDPAAQTERQDRWTGGDVEDCLGGKNGRRELDSRLPFSFTILGADEGEWRQRVPRSRAHTRGVGSAALFYSYVRGCTREAQHRHGFGESKFGDKRLHAKGERKGARIKLF